MQCDAGKTTDLYTSVLCLVHSRTEYALVAWITGAPRLGWIIPEIAPHANNPQGFAEKVKFATTPAKGEGGNHANI